MSATTPEADATPSKKLTADEMQKSALRLSTRPQRPLVLKELVATTKFASHDQESSSVGRMYDNAVKRKKAREEELEKKFGQRPNEDKEKVLGSGEVDDMVARVYSRSVIVQDETRKKLMQQYAKPCARDVKMDSAQLQTLTDRLYREARCKTAESQSRLFEKYVVSKDPKVAKRTKAETAEAMGRLTVKKGSS